jgi:Protein of unknown function (DUF2877)
VVGDPDLELLLVEAGHLELDDEFAVGLVEARAAMPNGIETELVLTVGEGVVVGAGRLSVATDSIAAGPRWEARPSPRFMLTVHPIPRVEPEQLSGWGPGLTPVGDDVLVGYLAAFALLGAPPPMCLAWESRTTALSQTLLELASLGELPEPAHALLETGDPRPLLRFGATSGKGIALGLAAATAEAAPSAEGRFTFELALPDGPHRFLLSVTDASVRVNY